MSENALYDVAGRLARYQERISEAPGVSENCKKEALAFLAEIGAEGWSVERQVIYATRLLPVCEMMEGKAFSEATEQDLRALWVKIQAKHKNEGTREIFRVCLKRLYKQLEGNGEEYPAKIKWLKPPRGKKKPTVKPADLLTAEEREAIISACDSSRDKCLLSLMCEMPLRIGEIASMTIGGVCFDEKCATIYSIGKTGARTRPFVKSIPALREWLSIHPRKNDKNAPLFCVIQTQTSNPRKEGKREIKKTKRSKRGDPLQYNAFVKIIKGAAKRAGITRRVWTHLFKHTVYTKLRREGTPQTIVENLAGHIPGSKMAKVYDGISDMDSINFYRDKFGEGKQPVVESTTQICPRCNFENSLSAAFCRCGMALGINAAVKVQSQTEELIEYMARLTAVLEAKPELKQAIQNEIVKQKMEIRK